MDPLEYYEAVKLQKKKKREAKEAALRCVHLLPWEHVLDSWFVWSVAISTPLSGVEMATDSFPPSSCCRENSFAHISELLIGQIKQKSSKKCVVLRMLHIFFAVLPFSVTLQLAYKCKIGKLDHMFLLRDDVLIKIKWR